MSVRRSPGSPSQMIAALLRRGPRTWRSRQLTLALSLPPTNHFACGGCPLEHRVPRPHPLELLREAGPEGLGIGGRARVDLGVVRRARRRGTAAAAGSARSSLQERVDARGTSGRRCVAACGRSRRLALLRAAHGAARAGWSGASCSPRSGRGAGRAAQSAADRVARYRRTDLARRHLDRRRRRHPSRASAGRAPAGRRHARHRAARLRGGRMVAPSSCGSWRGTDAAASTSHSAGGRPPHRVQRSRRAAEAGPSSRSPPTTSRSASATAARAARSRSRSMATSRASR